MKSPWIELGMGTLLTLLAVAVFRAGRHTTDARHARVVMPVRHRHPEDTGADISIEVGPDGVPLSAYAG